MSVRGSFVEKFGEDEAARLEKAAHGHASPDRNGKGTGSDPFKWVLCITIGFECFTREAFRDHHGIVTPIVALKQWIRDHGELDSHDGDLDFLALVAGAYDEYVPTEVH